MGALQPGTYELFVWISYGVTAIALTAAAIVTLAQYARVKRQLAALERAP